LVEFIVGIKFKKKYILTYIDWELHSQLDVTLSLSIFFNFFQFSRWFSLEGREKRKNKRCKCNLEEKKQKVWKDVWNHCGVFLLTHGYISANLWYTFWTCVKGCTKLILIFTLFITSREYMLVSQGIKFL